MYSKFWRHFGNGEVSFKCFLVGSDKPDSAKRKVNAEHAAPHCSDDMRKT